MSHEPLRLRDSRLPDAREAAYAVFANLLRAGALPLGDVETAVGASEPDRKSYFEFGGRTADHPRALTELRELLVDMLGSAAADIEALFFGGALGPLEHLVDWHGGPVLRMSWYPGEGSGLMNHDHADIALLTLLPAATTPGLEFLGKRGWERISPAPDEAIVLPGELTEALGGAPAMRHRVVDLGAERISASLFVNARSDLRTRSGVSAGQVFARRLEQVRRRDFEGGAR